MTASISEAFRALAAADFDTARASFAEGLTYHLLNLEPRHQRTFAGRDAFLGLNTSIGETTGGTYHFEVVALHEAGPELVIVHGATSASFQGRSCERLNWVIVARVIDGLIVQMTDTPETALDTFWRG